MVIRQASNGITCYCALERPTPKEPERFLNGNCVRLFMRLWKIHVRLKRIWSSAGGVASCSLSTVIRSSTFRSTIRCALVLACP
eukprot:gene19688-biopygen11543